MSIIGVFERVAGKMVHVIRRVKHLFRLGDDPEVVPPTPFEVGPTTDDLDPKTGKRYKDWRERRALRTKVLAETYVPKDLGDLHPGDHEGWGSHPR
ncbi:MAG: hypothetical protein NTV79_04365 [Candidatus Aureabacteria bacterium]|nr:hypothetical protein [Candidatus Auribacterota bacterium]